MEKSQRIKKDVELHRNQLVKMKVMKSRVDKKSEERNKQLDYLY